MKSLKCSQLHTREIGIPHCIDGQPCKRTYHVYLPRLLCHGGLRRLGGDGHDQAVDDAVFGEAGVRVSNIDNDSRRLADDDDDDWYFEGHHYRVGTLPLVFVLHGYGSDSTSVQHFITLADEYHFVLVFPEGLENSWNAGDCCGYSLENKVDDVGFLSLVQTSLAAEFDFVQINFAYGIGHNNGAFMLTYALEWSPHLFRAIVPISGYTHGVNLIKEQLGATGKGIGMMMHHSLDDYIIRPSGCCDNPYFPKCHGDVSSDWCMSVLQAFDVWAREVNMCDEGGGAASDGGLADVVVGRSGGVEYSVSHRGDSKSTVFSLTPDTNEPETSDKLFKSRLPMSVGYVAPDNEAMCLSTASSSCVANSTLCIYANRGDFPVSDSGPYMTNEVMEFIARDACAVNDGMLRVLPGNDKAGRKSKHVCACVVSSQNGPSEHFGGVFCYDTLNADGTYKYLTSSKGHDAPQPKPSSSASNLPGSEAAGAASEQTETSSTTTSTEAPRTTTTTTSETTGTAKQQPVSKAADSTLIQTESSATTPSIASFNTLDASDPTDTESSTQQNDTPLDSEAANSPAKQTETPSSIASFNTVDESHPTATESNTQGDDTKSTQVNSESTAEPITQSAELDAKLNETTPSSPYKILDKTSLSVTAPNEISPEISDPTTATSDAEQKTHSHTISAAMLLLIFAAVGVAVWRRRKRLKRDRSTHHVEFQYRDDANRAGSPYHDDRMGSPYRDFFQKNGPTRNANDGYGENEVDYRDAEVERDFYDSRYEERSPSRRNKKITELVSRRERKLPNIIGHDLDSERRSPYRYTPSMEPGGRHITDDYSYSESPYGADDDSSQRSVGSLSRLDSKDRTLLEKYRQKDRDSGSGILRRKSDSEDTDSSWDRSSLPGPSEVSDYLDDDLQKIESQPSIC